MQIYLVRHTTPAVAKGICYGQADIPINEQLFEEELRLIKSRISVKPEVFYSSPLKRCLHLAQELSLHVEEDDRLKELHFGDWELKKWDDLPADELQVWMDDFVNQALPHGENYKALYDRTCSFLMNLLQQPYERIAIITHAGNMRSIISWALDLPLENSFRIALPYGAIVHLELHKNKQLNQLKFII
ncbi:alpha-ribazole phosphatase [Pedobacter sp. CG_S7]|uniref:alpha-ribazole phosphatase n=1 Tax=Pedobacter sp. CG_S7 TaxID=3143930 RepID=UPI0033924166